MENILSSLIIIMFIVYMVYDEKNRGVVGITLCGLLLFYYGYCWGQMYNVYPNSDYKSIKYRNRVLWINTDMLDVMNENHKMWCQYVMMECAPNKLGIYVEKQFINKLFVLKQFEIFKIMFGYNCPYIYFQHTPNEIIKNFCKSKGVEIVYHSLRYTYT